jgi:hypothetical protein
MCITKPPSSSQSNPSARIGSSDSPSVRSAQTPVVTCLTSAETAALAELSKSPTETSCNPVEDVSDEVVPSVFELDPQAAKSTIERTVISENLNTDLRFDMRASEIFKNDKLFTL